MARLLHISASPRGTASESLRIADAFVEAYQQAHPDDEVVAWDLWDGSLPSFGADAINAQWTVLGGGTPTGAQGDAWQATINAVARFDAADRLLFSVPMWNGGIPYVLKQLIDVVSQPGKVFGVDPATGYSHLLAGRGKRAAVVYTSAVWAPGLGPEFGSNFQSTYFNDWLAWTGIDDITEIRFHPTLTGDADQARQTALAAARDAAKGF